jgi:hypothetical protein
MVKKIATYYSYKVETMLTLARYPVEEPEAAPVPSKVDLEAQEVADTYRHLPEPLRSLLLRVVRDFRAASKT